MKTRHHHGTVVEYRTKDPDVASSNPSAGKLKSLTGPIRTLPLPIPLHHSQIPKGGRGENQMSPRYSGKVQAYIPRDP